MELKYNIDNIENLNEGLINNIKNMGELYEFLRKLWEYMKEVQLFLNNDEINGNNSYSDDIYKEIDEEMCKILMKEYKTRIKHIVDRLMVNFIQYTIVRNIYFDPPEDLLCDYMRETFMDNKSTIPGFDELVNNYKVFSVIYVCLDGIIRAISSYKSKYKIINCPDVFQVNLQVEYQ